MVIFLKNDGSVAYTEFENINLGSNKANSLFVVAPFAPGAAITVAFKLPNGKTLGPGFVENQGVISFDENSVYNLEYLEKIPGYSFDGQNLSAWRYDLQSVITNVSGNLGIQLFIFTDGRIIPSTLVTVPVNVGVQNLLTPTAPTGDVYNEILDYLSNDTNYIVQQRESAAISATSADSSATAAANSANEARAWANGTYVDEEGNSQPVAADTPQYQKNAEYYAEQAAGSAESAKNYAEVIAPQEAEEAATEAANNALGTVNNRLDTAEDRLDTAEDRLDNVDYILEQFGAVKAQVDSSAALVKSIPARSDLFAYLNSIGGKTEKYNQLLKNEFWHFGTTVSSGQTVEHNGGTITNNGDGTYTLNGTFSGINLNLCKISPIDYNTLTILPEGVTSATLCVSLKNAFPSSVAPCFNIKIANAEVTFDDYGIIQSAKFIDETVLGDQYGDLFLNYISGDIHYGSDSVDKKYITEIGFSSGDVTLNNFVLAPMFNLGTSPLPWQSPADPFTGLRDGKVTALKVYGASLFDDVAFLQSHSFTLKDDGFWHGGTQWQTIWENTEQREGQISVSYTAELLSIEGNNTYYPIFFYVYYTDGSQNQIAPIAYNSKGIKYPKGTSTAGKTVKSVLWGSSQKGTLKIKDIMLNWGDSPVPYSTYKEPTTYELPEAVKALDLFGHGFVDSSTNKFYTNTVDLENKKYISYIPEKIVLDGENTKLTGFDTSLGVPRGLYKIKDRVAPSTRALDITRFIVQGTNASGFAYLSPSNTYTQVILCLDGITSLTEFNNWLKDNNVELVCAISTPIVTDISAKLGNFDPVIPVEPGGRIEFYNDHNYDVPSTVTYNIIQEA